MQRLKWDEICRRNDCKGRWVALDDCHYDKSSGKATDGVVVDADEDLVELCNRIRQADRTNCEIVFCGSVEEGVDGSKASDPFRTAAH